MSTAKKSDSGKKSPLWSIILLILVCIFIAILISISFFFSEEKYVISSNVIILLCLLVVLVLCDKVENLTIGKEGLSFSNKNGNEKSVNKMDENEKQEQNDEIYKNTESEKISSKRFDNDWFRTIVLNNYYGESQKYKIVRDVKVVERFQDIDSISNKPVFFDAYLEEKRQETFIVIRAYNYSAFMIHDRLYVQLNKLKSCKGTKKTDISLLLLIGKTNNESDKKFSDIEKYFEPAIKNGLLTIKYVNITEAEYDSCYKSINKYE